MSLPLRLPHCFPALRQPVVLRLPFFPAPVTPPPSPAWPLELDCKHQGDAREGCLEEKAWVKARGHPGGGALSYSTCTIPQSPRFRGLSRAQHFPEAQPRPLPAACSSSSLYPGSRSCAGGPQATRAPLLGRRSSAPQSYRRAKDRQPGASGTASAGRKKPEPRVNSQIEWSWRSIEEATPPLPVHWTFAGSEFAGLRTHLEKKSGKLGKLPSASTEKSQGNCRNLAWNTKRSGQAQMNC
ncbi:uncharacterized protein LOC143379654 [Callospermophilus lateralis]|uniref:uncharacterized protein LOC143379654 n=1 Tax=Callospermophilus lateralis TaxID=76772 RepID=UPI0040387A74